MLDGSEVKVGDVVYDILLGSGKVLSVGDNSFVVKLGNSKITVLNDGYVGLHKRVYWHNPVMITPTKDGTVYELVKTQANSMFTSITKLCKTLAG